MNRLGQAVNDVLAIDPTAPALEFEERWLSWGALAAAKSAIEGLVAQRGRALRVGVLMRNRPDAAAATLACVSRGDCLVTINPLLPDEKLVDDILQLQPAALIANEDDWRRPGLAEAAGRVGCLQISTDSHLDHAPLLRARGLLDVEQLARRDAPEVGVEMLTSGTTGAPKRIPLRADAFADSVLSALEFESGRNKHEPPRLRAGVQILLAPISHIGGLMSLLNAVIGGRRACLLERFSVAQVHSAIRRHRPKVVSMPPAALRMLLDADLPREDFSSLVAIRTGTAPLDPDLADAVHCRYGAPVLQNYGATEFGGVAGWTIADYRDHWREKRGSVGRLNSGVEARIVDAGTGALAPVGETGVLELRGERIGDGRTWLTTTDLAALDEDQFLYIKGRTDQTIIRGGFKVNPDDIVRALQMHDAILEASVVALPDPRLGQVPAAVYVLRQGCPDPGAGALTAFLRQHLTPYQIPTQYRVVGDLPRTASMKVSQPALRSLFETGS